MSKSKQPVFEKPEEPDFIKRLRTSQQDVGRAQERPMTDAPAREDELPAIANEVAETDLDQLRELHGLEKHEHLTKSAEGPAVSVKQRPASESSKLAGLGNTQNLAARKRLRHLEELKAKPSLTEDQAAETEATVRSRSVNQTRPVRKKMKVVQLDS